MNLQHCDHQALRRRGEEGSVGSSVSLVLVGRAPLFLFVLVLLPLLAPLTLNLLAVVLLLIL
jgi:hypothetical protein